MASPRRQRVLALSLALSLALHVLLAVSLRNAPPIEVARQPTPVELEVVERVKPPLPPKLTPPPQLVPPPPPPHLTPRRHLVSESTAAVAPPPSAPEPTPSQALELPPDVPRVAPPDLRDAAQAAASLHAPPGGSDGIVVELVPDAGSLRFIHAPDVIADPNARVADMINAKQGRARVQRGLVDPYFQEVSKALAKYWTIDPTDTKANLASYFSHLGDNTKRGMKIWQSLADTYGEGGSPLGPTDEPHGAQTQQEAVNEFNAKLRDAWKQTKRTLVRITQGPGGLVQRVELVQSSADPGLDAEIMRELTQGELVLPVPPTTGMGIKNPIRSVWAFQLVISISPPVPALMGSFDEVTGTVDLRLPLDRRVYKTVELVSVD